MMIDSSVMVALITAGGSLLLGVANMMMSAKNSRVKTIEERAVDLERELAAVRKKCEACEEHRQQLLLEKDALERARVDLLTEVRTLRHRLDEAEREIETLKRSRPG